MMRAVLKNLAYCIGAVVFLGFIQLCLLPLFSYASDEVRLWLATPTPTPIALSLDVDPDDASNARETAYAWFREQQELHATPDPDLEEKAYYLAGEAPRLLLGQTWPEWYGLRYAVGPLAGQWLKYWPGGAHCHVFPRRGASLATFELWGLAEANQVGAAIVWRGEQPYLAIVWPGTCPPPQPTPPLTGAGPDGPGW